MPSRLRVAGAFALGIAGISTAALFVRLALPAPPVATGFWRMALASGVIGAWLAARGEPLAPRGRALALALAAGACFGADLAMWHTSIVLTSLANATLLVNTTPIYVGILSTFLLGERPGRGFAAGAALALLGTALLVGADWRGGDAVRGDALALVAALFYSGYLLAMRAVRRSAAAGPALFASGLGATAVLGAAALARGDPLAGYPTHSWVAIACLAFIAQLGGVLGIVWSLAWLRASFASVALLAQPLGTALLAWIFLGEGIGPAQALGGIAVGLGILLAAQENFRSSHQG